MTDWTFHPLSGVVIGRGRDLEVCPSLSQVVPTTALCASLSDGNRVMSQLEESARIVLDGIHGQSNPEINIETGGDDLHTHAEVSLNAPFLPPLSLAPPAAFVVREETPTIADH